MLENVRFYSAEEENSKMFAGLLAYGFDLIVFDAFAQAHRVHASTTGITKFLPTYAGFLVEKEINSLNQIIKKPKRPLVAIIGGAKISDKVAVLEELVKMADKILIGGGVANIFLKAIGVSVGHSYLQDNFIDQAKRKKVNFVKLARKIYQRHKNKIVLPTDFISANKMDQGALVEMVDAKQNQKINPRFMFLDIGPGTIARYLTEIKKAKTIFWNGPMGVFEINKFAFGTKKIAEAVARSQSVSVLGGGDTESVVKKYNLEGKFSYVSTGGGASLEFLAGRELPALKNIQKAR